MASLDKTSVRAEVSQLKTDFERLCAEGKISSETKTLFTSMFMIIELILAIFLERTTKKDNKNSSKPSSQTDKDESSLSHQGSNGKGKNENNNLAKNTRVHENVKRSRVTLCDICAEDLSDTPAYTSKDGQKLTLFLRKSLSMWMLRLSNAPLAIQRSRLNFPPTCMAPCNMAMV